MVYIVIGENEFIHKVMLILPSGSAVIRKSSFSALSEEKQYIEEHFRESNDRSCVLVHDEKCAIPIGEALFLREICGAQIIHDWCCSPLWELYVKEASNAPLLSKRNVFYMDEVDGYHLETSSNPFNSVLFGTELNEKWNDKRYSSHIKRECLSLKGIVRSALLQYMIGQYCRKCSLQDYNAITNIFGIRLESIEKNMQQGVSVVSFYDDDLQWEDLFSKRKTMNINKVIRLRVNQFEGMVEANAKRIKDQYKNVFREIELRYENDDQFGAGFIYDLFVSRIIPEIQETLRAIAEEKEIQNNIEMRLKNEIEKSAEIASRTSGFSMNREMAMEDYINAIESFYICLNRQRLLSSLKDIIKELEKNAKQIADEYEGILSTWKNFIDMYKEEFDEKNLALFQIKDSDKEIITRSLLEKEIVSLEQTLMDKYAEEIKAIIRIRERNESVQIKESSICWFNIEDVALNNQMSEVFEEKLKNAKARKNTYRQWIMTFLIDEGILHKTDAGYVFQTQKLRSKPMCSELIPAELLLLHRKIEYERIQKTSITIPVNGKIDDLVDYLQRHSEIMRLLDEQSCIQKKNTAINEDIRSALLINI